MADNFIVKDGNGASLIKASKDIGSGVQADKVLLVDSAGASLASFGIDQTTPGTTNRVAIGTDGKVAIQQGGSDVGAANVLYVGGSDVAASGTISTQNLVPAGVATANSAVEISMVDKAVLMIQISGTYTGILSLQGTVDGTNWVTFSNDLIFKYGASGGYSAFSTNIASAAVGLFGVDAAGFQKVRLTALAAVTGSASISMRASAYPGPKTAAATLYTGANGTGNAIVQTASASLMSSFSSTKRKAAGGTVAADGLNVKASTGAVIGGSISNLSASLRYLKFYNKASAPTVGTDTPVFTIPVQPNSTLLLAEFFSAMPTKFSTGISFAMTTGIDDTDVGVVTAGDLMLNLIYV